MENATLLAQLKRVNGPILIGMDTDEAGQAAVVGTAAALMDAGIRPTQIRVVTWPAHDANDWLQAGGTADQVTALLSDCPSWVDVLTERAMPANGGAADDAGLRELFAVLARLDVYDLARVRERTCDRLGLRRSEFDTILRATRREIGLSDDGRPKYQVVAGRTCHRYYDKGGNEVCDVLAHFDARITAEVVEDDGSRQERRFTIEGKLADGAKLPEVEVAAADYPAMSWVLETWGAKALIEAGSATKDHLRAAIQLLSPAAPTRYIYSHIGWRTINGQPVYLGTTGAVGYEGVEVRVIQDLARYKLPIHPERPREAMEASLRFLEVGDYAVTIPLWAAMYLAPLSSIIEPAFTLWVFGTTGSLKSTITALAVCHFGTFAYNTPPASWTGTANALEKKAFLVKDAPLWIDDYVTQSTFGGMNELRAKVDQLLRDWGNRAGRSRMRADLSLRQTFAPRGLIISTAEQLPQGQSIQARLFQIEVDPTMITRGGGSPLTAAQVEEAPLYPHAMGGYLLWLAEQMKSLEEQLPQKLLDYTEAAREKGAHLRMPMNVASLFLGWELGLQYARQVGAIDAEKYEALHSLGWNILVGLGEAQRVAAEEEKPVEMYLGAIEEMLAQGSVYLKHRWYPEIPDREFPSLANRMAGAELIGWYGNDEQDGSTYDASRYWYLIPGVTYKDVVEFYRGAGVVFPDTARGIKVKLREQKLLFPGEDRPFDFRISALLPRVLRIVRPTSDEGSTDL